MPNWKFVLLLSAALAALPGAAAPAQQSAPQAAISAARSAADRLAADLVAKLTLDEKVEQRPGTNAACMRPIRNVVVCGGAAGSPYIVQVSRHGASSRGCRVIAT